LAAGEPCRPGYRSDARPGHRQRRLVFEFAPREVRFIRVNLLHHHLNSGVHIVAVRAYENDNGRDAVACALALNHDGIPVENIRALSRVATGYGGALYQK
jgi:hypothetical protein